MREIPNKIRSMVVDNIVKRLVLTGFAVLFVVVISLTVCGQQSDNNASAEVSKPVAPGDPGTNPPPDDSGPYTLSGVFTADGGAAQTETDKTYISDTDDVSAVYVTNGGEITLYNVNMTTSGPHSAPIATDRGSGTITVTGGTVMSSGEGSPGIYATGVITVTDLRSTATGSEAVVIEGKNIVNVTNSMLKGEKLCGVIIYQSFSGDAEVGVASFTMIGGSLSAAAGPLFYVTNTNAEVTLTGVNATAASGKLINVSDGRWGTAGSNGGNLTFTTDQQHLTGDIEVNNISTLTVTLRNGSTLTGAINSANTGKEVNLTLDATSTWREAPV